MGAEIGEPTGQAGKTSGTEVRAAERRGEPGGEDRQGASGRDVETEALRGADGSLPFKTQKYGSLPEQFGPVSLKLFIHHTGMRQNFLLRWCRPSTKAAPVWGGDAGRAEPEVGKETEEWSHPACAGMCPISTSALHPRVHKHMEKAQNRHTVKNQEPGRHPCASPPGIKYQN